MAFFDPSDTLERQRIERKRYLESKVAETLALKPSKPGANLKRAEHGTYKLSPDEEKQAILEYRRQSRQARILQVRAQEMLHAAECVGEFRQRKKRDKKKLLQVLKDAWQEEQAKRKADLEADYLELCKGIGQSHEAAQLVAQNSAIIAEQKAKEAEESRLWGTIRFQKAMQEENERKLEVLQEQRLAKGRRTVLSEAAAVDRRRARIHACHARSEAREEEKLVVDEERPEHYLKINFDKDDIRRNFIQSRLPGAPSDYKDTYFHSRFSVLKDRSNCRRSVGADQIQHEAEVDAWEAAEAQMKNVQLEKERKAELEELWKRRKAERGRAAAAKLQKIASLEKELAVELEEEQERKHQLEVIEELTRAVHSPVYKPDSWRHLQPTNSPASKETDGLCGANFGEFIAKNMPKADDASRSPESKVLYSGSNQPCLILEGEESVPTIEHSSLTVVGDELSALDVSTQRNLEGRVNEDKPEAVDAEDAETEIMKAAASKEERSAEQMKSSFPTSQAVTSKEERWAEELKSSSHPSQVKVPGHTIGGLSGKSKDKDGATQGPAISAKLPCCTQRIYGAVNGIKAPKDVRPSSKVSSLPNLSRKSGVRKGNKSPEKHEIERAPRVHECQDAADYIKEFKVRSKAIGKDQAQPSVNMVDEDSDENAGLPAIAHSAEGCTTKARNMSLRKEGSNWLANILEKFSWWTCDAAPKDFFCPGVGTAQEKVEGCLKSGEQTDRLFGFENVGKVSTPRTKQVDESSQEMPPPRRNIPFRMETLGSLNTLRETDWYCEEQPGWSEARTKVVFSKEELEALKLELYGTLTGETITSQQKKAILRKEKTKHVSKSQGLNTSLSPRQQKARFVDYENDQLSRSQLREEGLENLRSPTPKVDKTKSMTRQQDKISVACQQWEGTPVYKSQTTDDCHELRRTVHIRGNQNHDKKPPTKDSATQYTSAEFECTPRQEHDNSNESVEKEEREVRTPLEVPRSTSLHNETDHNANPVSSDNVNFPGSSSANQQGVACSDSITSIEKGKASHELTSALEVAEELIRAWQTGQLGGDMHATFQRAKQNVTQVSRKRRATIVEEAQVSTSYPGTTQKLGQLREKINRPQQNSATKLRKWDILTPSQSGVSPEKKDSNVGSTFKSRDLSRNAIPSRQVQSPSRASLQHCKEETSRVSTEKFPEEALNVRVEDVVPEARSLDFILGSLSAQVRELDERLQNVTACSMGTKDASFVCSSDTYEEQKHVSRVREAAKHVPLADRVSQAVSRSGRGLQRSTSGESERFKIPVCLQNTERQRVNRAKSTKGVPVNPPKSPHKEDGHPSSLQEHQDKTNSSNTQMDETRLSGSILSSIPQAQSPISSMGIFMEDMADLMQEMNGSPACEKMRAQLLQDSFLENLPRRCESGTIDIKQEDIEPRRSGGKNRDLDTVSGTKSQEERGRSSKFAFKKFAEICSGKAEPAILDGFGAPVAEKQFSDGMTASPAHALTRCPLRQPERISQSSLDLEEALRLNGSEEHLLLSTSVDFSPWNTANIPDVFTSITDVGRSLNYTAQLGCAPPDNVSKIEHAHLKKISKYEHCHLKESSKYLLKNNEFKKKCKAFEKKRLGRGKGKHKKNVRKPFNPIALPPKRQGVNLSKSSTTRSLQPEALNLSRRDVKLTSRSKSKLTSRSLPEEFPMSVAAEEVQKWLRRDATGCSAVPPDDDHDRIRGLKYPQYPASKRPATAGRSSPPLGLTTPDGEKLTKQFDRRSLIKRDMESRRRPYSAGIILSSR